MIQPIRPNDAMGIYQRQTAAAEAAAGLRPSTLAGRGRAARRTDQVSISSEAQQLRHLLDAVQTAPADREARIAALRDQLATGAYHVDAAQIARRMVEGGNDV